MCKQAKLLLMKPYINKNKRKRNLVILMTKSPGWNDTHVDRFISFSVNEQGFDHFAFRFFPPLSELQVMPLSCESVEL